eukprot:CAMPEP_0196656080 /NCGR_PEP_ID=MMETSP1086-20130531/13038_1 /TAXON_ID=77921 /ORGANISM="Cyanoptyche  gloeocystis , Strain SAG4.97" /LENGTH=59 /DNA_ID=CAMNT_0041988689 /DNA_START=1640 /DNA_END=1815 /DNA_ORIENTATION=+
MSFACGVALTPDGGSSCSFLKSLINLRLAGVDIPKFRPEQVQVDENVPYSPADIHLQRT